MCKKDNSLFLNAPITTEWAHNWAESASISCVSDLADLWHSFTGVSAGLMYFTAESSPVQRLLQFTCSFGFKAETFTHISSSVAFCWEVVSAGWWTNFLNEVNAWRKGDIHIKPKNSLSEFHNPDGSWEPRVIYQHAPPPPLYHRFSGPAYWSGNLFHFEPLWLTAFINVIV